MSVIQWQQITTRKTQINNHPPECSIDIFWMQGRKCRPGEAKGKRKKELIVTCSWCLNICCNISNLCIFKMTRVAITVGWSREKDCSVAASAGCLKEGHLFGWTNLGPQGEPANLLMLPLVLQKKNWGTPYHVMQMAAEGIYHKSFFDMNYMDCWCRFQSDNKSGSNNGIEFCKEYTTTLCRM